MVRALISWCVRNPLLTTLFALGSLAWGWWALERVPVDAIPDVGERQVIVFADWPGRSPQDVDAQVTYPLTAALQGAPGVTAVRAMSGFGFSMAFVVFGDDADYYAARTRVLERLSSAQGRLPDGVTPVLGPDATALGQVYWYTLEGEGFSLEELRTTQDWFVRWQLNAVEGVSEVASIGGHVREYQIDVDPERLRAHRVTVPQVVDAVARSNLDVGAKAIEESRVESFVRGVGFVASPEDLEQVVIRQSGGTPLFVRNVATVSTGPEFRRGALNKAGAEAVGGIVLARVGANPRRVVEAVKRRVEEIAPGLPERVLPDGRVSKVRIVPYYDRSTIIDETLDTLRSAVTEELFFAAAVVLVFLLHLRASVAILATLPLSMGLAYVAMHAAGVDANIMSVAGLAIAIGDVADMGIIMVENVYRRLAERPDSRGDPVERRRIVEAAAHEVGPAILAAVSNTVISFIPVFFLTGEEGRLFRPLAFTKTFAITASVVLALTVVPSLALVTLRDPSWRRRTRWLVALACGVAAAAAVPWIARMAAVGGGGWSLALAAGVIVAATVLRITSERLLPLERNPTSRLILYLYEPALRWVLAHKALFLALPALLVVAGLATWLGFARVFGPVGDGLEGLGVPVRDSAFWAEATRRMPGLGREFMPPLDEGSFLYMPSLLPAASLTQAMEVVGVQNAAIATVPEVLSVVGKVGRSDSALDPAPVGMVETVITLRPEAEWRRVPVRRFFSDWPDWVRGPLAAVWPEERAVTKEEILRELQAKTAIPGVLPTWLQPIQTRLVMLSSGFRAMMGVKIFGPDLREIERIGLEMERELRRVPGAVDVVADRIVGKPYVECVIDRVAAARHGVLVGDVQQIIETAIGGERTTRTVEGAARFPVRVRFPRELRDSAQALGDVLVPASNGAQVPLSAVATFRHVLGPQEIKSENVLKVGYVTLNTRDRDEVSVVEEADALLKARIADGTIRLPEGYYYRWGGQFEAQVRATERLSVLVPAVVALMVLMLWISLGRWWLALIVFGALLVSLSGGFLILGLWGVNLSVAVWVGMIALLGVADDDAVVMLTHLENGFRSANPKTPAEVRDLVVEGARKRIRPCLMTMATTVIGLLPVFLTQGRGSDVMQPMALPSIGGMAVQILAPFMAPCIYCMVMERRLRARAR